MAIRVLSIIVYFFFVPVLTELLEGTAHKLFHSSVAMRIHF